MGLEGGVGMGHRHFARLALGLVAGVLGVSAFINVAVDPYDLYGLNRFGNHIGLERDAKQTWIRRQPHDAVLIGSSKLDFVDPRELERFDFFNASMGGAMPEEMEEFLRLHVDGVRGVVVGFDFFMFNESCFPLRPTLRRTWEDYVFRFPFNRKGLEYSWHTVRRGLLGREPVILPWGQMNPLRTEQKDATVDDYDYSEGIPYLEQYHFRDYRFSDYRVERMRVMRHLLEERAIPFVVIMNPMNEAIRAWVREQEDLEPLYQRFKREVLTVFPDAIDLTESRYAEMTGFYKLDPLHFRPETGTEFLNQVVIPELERRSRAVLGH